ncbi:MAG: hypothetical protein K0R17_515 [Rariglobus sp.]|jgi:parallel beta-helix repeat protein|nr:hypothetical protein [Rariglobus sp.]
MRLACLVALAIRWVVPVVSAAGYYVDPASGDMANPGTSARPWSTLEAVFTAGKTFAAGDVIYLRDGYHGEPVVKGKADGAVTITAQPGHKPGLRSLTFDNAAHWIASGLRISPEISGAPGKVILVKINASSRAITLEDCDLYSAGSIAGWTKEDWLARACGGITSFAPATTLRNNRISAINHGIVLNRECVGSRVSRNTIANFSADGIRGLSDDTVYDYNLVKNAFAVDANHDDGFQSWSGGRGGEKVGSGVVKNVTLRGNTFISYTDPDQPLKSRMQGIGCFDGFFENWTVENNLVVTDQYQGIAFYGARNCRIVNNTVIKNPINGHDIAPWLKVTAHKNKSPSTGNTVRNNLVWAMTNAKDIGTEDHNLVSTNPEEHFVNYAGFNFMLIAGSKARDAGSATLAPVLDIDEVPRDAHPDIGAFEYGGGRVATRRQHR